MIIFLSEHSTLCAKLNGLEIPGTTDKHEFGTWGTWLQAPYMGTMFLTQAQ
jgi:hypothetical protein